MLEEGNPLSSKYPPSQLLALADREGMTGTLVLSLLEPKTACETIFNKQTSVRKKDMGG